MTARISRIKHGRMMCSLEKRYECTCVDCYVLTDIPRTVGCIRLWCHVTRPGPMPGSMMHANYDIIVGGILQCFSLYMWGPSEGIFVAQPRSLHHARTVLFQVIGHVPTGREQQILHDPLRRFPCWRPQEPRLRDVELHRLGRTHPGSHAAVFVIAVAIPHLLLLSFLPTLRGAVFPAPCRCEHADSRYTTLSCGCIEDLRVQLRCRHCRRGVQVVVLLRPPSTLRRCAGFRRCVGE